MQFRQLYLLGMFLLFLGTGFFIQGHEGHSLGVEMLSERTSADPFSVGKNTSELASWLTSIGRFHLLFLHFPIALTVMTVVAELLWIWFANPLFTQAARFMLFAAAIFAPPTVLLGWALGSGQHYEGVQLDLYVWHRYFGILTAVLAVSAAVLRERYVQQKSASVIGYYVCLFFLFLSVSLTGAFGGSLAFGLDVW